MLVPFPLTQSSGVLDVIPKIASPFNLGAFALAVVLFLVLKKQKGQIPPVAWFVIVLLVAIPVGASVYSGLSQKPSIYRLRVIVIDPQGIPVEDAKVWPSISGESMRTSGGWKVEIPEANKPKDGKLTILAAREDGSSKGEAELALSNDYNPTVKIQLKYDDSAKVRGQVVDARGNAVANARVWVVGYGKEMVTTQADGNFELPAHAAVDQPVRLHAERPPYQATEDYARAGGASITLTLTR